MASIIETSIDGGLGRLVLNHPPLNILTQQMLTEMRAALRSLEASPAVRVLLVSARGKHFSAGADVQEHLPPHYRQMIPEFLETIAAIEAAGSRSCRRPTSSSLPMMHRSGSQRSCLVFSHRRRAFCSRSVAPRVWPRIWCFRGP